MTIKEALLKSLEDINDIINKKRGVILSGYLIK